LVARLNWVQKVGSTNLTAPTILINRSTRAEVGGINFQHFLPAELPPHGHLITSTDLWLIS